MNACPPREQLELWLYNRLGLEERAQITAHVQTCESCKTLVAAMSPLGPTLDQRSPSQRKRDEDQDDAAGLPSELRDHARYKVTGVLGRGGMGTVFKAEHRLLERPLVLKVIRPEFLDNSSVVQRFQREAKLAAKLSHPNIVGVYEAEQLGLTHLLVMELVEGVNLAELVQQRGLLPVAESCELVRQTAVGLQHVHDSGLVHRDIKPANLLVSPAGVVKILDLGLATLKTGKPADGGLTADRQFLGTVDYAAPEQWENSHDVDIRADIYSLGCTLYFLLAGQAPFPSSKYVTTMQQMWAHSQAPRPSIRVLRPDVPEEIANIITRMLATNPADRFATPADVVTALEPFVTDCNLAEFVRTARRTTTSRLDLSRISSSRVGHTPPPPPPVKSSRRAFVIGGIAAVVAAGVAVAIVLAGGGEGASAGAPSGTGGGGAGAAAPSGAPIKVGVLHSMSGTMSISERSVVDATLMAIDELNAAGGVLGRPVEAVVEDGESDAATFAAKAEKLIATDKVVSVFGCWTSACRKTVLPIFEKHDSLLFYPVQYEGLEQSPNIVYTGAAPNQQIIPAIKWSVSVLKKKRFFLVGSDYIFPRAANAIIRDQAQSLGAEVVGEEYLRFGSSDVSGIVTRIVEAKPDAILNTINGDSNVAFFRALRAAGITSAKVPTISFSIAEQELSGLATKDLIGDYAAWNYFETVARPQNKTFIERFRARYGKQRVVSDPMEAAYFGVYLWAQAVREAGSDQVAKIRTAVGHQSFEAPEGLVRVDPETQHTSRVFRVGQITGDSRFAEVYSSESPIAPIPYPNTRSKGDWDAFLLDLNMRWGGRWEAP